MTVLPDKLAAELLAAGVPTKAISGGGRVVLTDGTVIEPDGRVWHEDDHAVTDEAARRAPNASRASTVMTVRAAHDPTPPPPPPRRDVIAALAVFARDGQAAPVWALEAIARCCDEADERA